jgi:hypothetical protein
MMINSAKTNLEQITEPIDQAQPQVRAIIEQVLQLEKEKLYQKNLRYINDDILKIIKENIQ